MENLLPIIKQLPAQVLLEFEEKPLTMAYMEQIPHNGFWSPMSNTLIIGNFDGMTDQYNTLLAVLTHELGHYLDLYNTSETSSTIDIMNTFNTTNSKFANNPEVIAIFKEEFTLNWTNKMISFNYGFPTEFPPQTAPECPGRPEEL